MQRSPPHSDVVVISTRSVGRLELKKVKWLAQDHVAGKRQRLTLNQICLAGLFSPHCECALDGNGDRRDGLGLAEEVGQQRGEEQGRNV